LAWQKLAFDNVVADAGEKIQRSGGWLFIGRRSALGLIRILHHDPTLNAEKLDVVMTVARKLDDHGWVTEIELDFRDSGIRDADIKLLQGLRKLEKVDLSVTPVTEQGVAELVELYPNIKIVTNNVTSHFGK
jgi:hypothetical protein